MILVNTDYITGKELQMIGLVQGATIQSKNIGKDIGAGLKGLVGGELSGYTEMMTEARNIATERMISMAKSLGADAIVNVRFTTSSVTAGAAEVMAYGTAVKFK
ncbi:YbjQ family protein [Anaerotignum sp.]|uniref:YbjQ family protein n=1 Tax=Anaerotignum sp. TaxID=2039241 RepID=UPI0028A586E8|nr:YbjQ family protein [Anaerotignum sp.]